MQKEFPFKEQSCETALLKMKILDRMTQLVSEMNRSGFLHYFFLTRPFHTDLQPKHLITGEGYFILSWPGEGYPYPGWGYLHKSGFYSEKHLRFQSFLLTKTTIVTAYVCYRTFLKLLKRE